MLDGFPYQVDGIPYELQRKREQAKKFLIPSERKYSSYLLVKRFFDILLSVIALIVLSPLMLLTVACIKVEDGGPVFYNQFRAGKDGKKFRLYKFRSMDINADKKLDKLKKLNESDGLAFKICNDPRVTKVGKVIRKLSIDELPQLVNILQGYMTIVGPRPPLLSEMEQYTPEQMHRLDVKPGLTCYWQCSGRSNLSFDEWMELDYKYIREQSLWTDTKIILKTVPAVLTAKGAY